MQSPGWLMLILTQFCSCFCWADEQKTICLFLINSNMRHGSGTINLSSIGAMSTWIVATQQKSLRGTMMEMECEARKIMIQQKMLTFYQLKSELQWRSSKILEYRSVNSLLEVGNLYQSSNTFGLEPVSIIHYNRPRTVINHPLH